MAVFEIPLLPQAQSFQIPLSNKLYNLTLKYMDTPEGGWVLDIDDTQGVALVHGVPLVTGADLLAQYAYLGIGGQLIVQTDENPDAVPLYTNLGVNSRVYFITGD